MKKFICFIFLFGTILSAQDMMRIKMKDGSLQIFPIETISKITFDIPTSVDDRTQKLITNVLQTFALLPNYPNPFNPTTTITYTIPQSNVVAVRIYDVTGRLITTLYDAYQESGEHRIIWNGRNSAGQLVSSGMYISEIRFEGSVITRKMMMLK
ncbi:MAG: T9SS type A sorting domain-containing protein [Bacteroidota bacterium]